MQTSQQIKEKIRGMSPKTKEIAFSPELFEIIDRISVKNNLNKDQSKLLFSLIFNALVNITDETYLRSNISHYIGNDSTLNQKILDAVGQSIFENIDNLYQEIVKNNEGYVNVENDESTALPIQKPQEIQTSSNVGNDFEQIIINQAKAMMPARERSHPLASTSQVPENLPVRSGQQSVAGIGVEEKTEENKVIHNYIGESDPYREPLQ